MTKMTLLPKRAALWGRAQTAPVLGRTTIDERRLQLKIVRIDRDVRFLSRFVRVSDRRLHAFFDSGRCALVRITQNRQRLIDVLTADHVNDQPRFLRRSPKIFCARSCFHDSFARPLPQAVLSYAAGAAGAAAAGAPGLLATVAAFSDFVPE